MKKIFLFSLAVLLINCNNLTSSKEKLNTLIEVYQNYAGNKRDEFPLGDYRESRFEKYAAFCDSIKAELETIDGKSLSEDDKISYKLLHFKLKETLVKYNFKTHWNPILSDAGFHSSLIYRVRPITSKKTALKYLTLLKAIPTYIDQQKELISKGLEAGIGQPLVIFEGYESTYEQHITPTAEENFYYSPFLNLPEPISKIEKDSLREAAK